MSDAHNCKFKKVKDFNGETLILTLVKKQDFVGKPYSLYSVCKIIKDENGKEIKLPLYNETFTKKQIDSFYNNSSYYTPADEKEDL